MTEHELVNQAQSGDDRAFQDLIEKHYRTVQKFAFQIGIDSTSVEDVTQDVFLKVYRSLGSYAGGTFTTWLYSITLNAVRDHLRKEKRQKRNAQIMKEKGAATPFAKPESNEISWELHDMITHLPEKYRIPLILHYFHEQSYREISEVIGISEGAVKTRVMRARKQLKERFEKVGVRHE
ncbi:RNA polymerase sigma factor [Salibacterium salarium]|uniref:RNA polymerase sigma factor n=1 Tax=Salibacterium salarium TaxID=284579 RepID=A0A3R9WLH2_9BACI|nr:RNA polymerase sigma factor [Salibacterium salarium]RSL28944.1 RNA polymerase sigma factor [Salibacterium salarium]